MKTFALISALSLSLSAFGMKHADETLERACYSQAKKAGCVKKNGDQDQVCARVNKTKISKNCHALLGMQ